MGAEMEELSLEDEPQAAGAEDQENVGPAGVSRHGGEEREPMRESQMTVRAGRPGHWMCSCSRPVTEGHDNGALQLPALCTYSRLPELETHDSGALQLQSRCLGSI